MIVPDLNDNELMKPIPIEFVMNKKEFEPWYKSVHAKSEFFQIAMVSKSIAKSFGTKNRGVFITGETAVKQKREHPGLTSDDYSVLSSISHADALIRDSKATILFFYISNKMYKAAVKKTNKAELLLTSFHRTDMKYLKSVVRRGEVIFNNIEL